MTIALYHYFAFLYSLICLLICPSRIKPSRALGGDRGARSDVAALNLCGPS